MAQCWIATGRCGHIIGATSCDQEESVVAKDCADWEKRGLKVTLIQTEDMNLSKWCPPECPTRSPAKAQERMAHLTAERDALKAALADLVLVCKATVGETRACAIDDGWCLVHDDEAEDGVCLWGRDAAALAAAERVLKGGA